MDYYSLDEAAELLSRLPGASTITANALLRYGVTGRIQICVPLDTKAYSPTVRQANDAQIPNSGYDPQGDIDRATVEVYGLFAVPPRHLFWLESHQTVRLEVVYSLGGECVYYPFVEINCAQLRITRTEVERIAARFNAESPNPPGSSVQRTEPGQPGDQAAADSAPARSPRGVGNPEARRRLFEIATAFCETWPHSREPNRSSDITPHVFKVLKSEGFMSRLKTPYSEATIVINLHHWPIPKPKPRK